MTECFLCGAAVPVWLKIEPQDYTNQPERAFLAKYEGKAPCIDCLQKIEIEYIKGIPLEDLPLFISAEWLTCGGTSAYLARLSGRSYEIRRDTPSMLR